MATESITDVSIIIPSYNVEHYIEAAIQSALAQEQLSIEVIVVDDFSRDKTVQVAKSIKDNRVSVIELTKNSGPGAARNEGIKVAKGTWISVLDGDDTFNTNRLITCIDRANAAQADIVIDNLLVVSKVDEKEYCMFTQSLFKRPSTLSLSDYINGNCSFLGGWTLGYTKPIFRKSFITHNKIQYPEDIRIGEDYIFMADMLASGAKCITEPSAGYRYLLRKGSTSYRIDQDSIMRIVEADRKLLSRHQLDFYANKAQRRRNQKLHEATAFIKLIESIKAKSMSGVIGIAFHCPFAFVYLWRPTIAKLKLISERMWMHK